MTLIDKAEALAALRKAGILRDEAYDAIAALPARGVGVDCVLDAAHNYLMAQYGHSPLKHPVDRARILAALAPTDAPHVNETPKSEHDGADVLTDAAQAREAVFLGVCECGMTGPCMWDQCKHPLTQEDRT